MTYSSCLYARKLNAYTEPQLHESRPQVA
uniref:Uncharacterized protein n=1 Tax=Rhizophora mucronata TaxID=61149 RepID=A0A2P2NWI9_RHIMU